MGRLRAGFGLLALISLVSLAVAGSALAAVEGNENARGGQVLIGNDDDDPANPTIQPPGVVANQSLRKGDQLIGGRGADLLIGRLGPDTLLSGVNQFNEKGDVIVGGTERGSDVTAFPPFDIARSGWGDDTFIWAPGDGSDAFIGGEPPSRVTVFKKKRITVGNRRIRVLRKVRVRTKPDTDTLVLGSLLLTAGDNSQPRLFDSRFGELPRVFASDRNLPASLSDTTPTPPIIGFCEIVRAPAGLGYDHLVRFFVEATGVHAVTIRVKGVEQVLCGTRNGDGITRTSLGRRGNSDPEVVTTDFQPRQGSKLDALVD